MLEISDIELFEKASQGELSKARNDVFVRRLAEDADFKAHYEKYKETISAIKQQQHYEELMVVLNESYKSKDWAAPTVEIKNAPTSLKHWVVTAVLLIFVVVITFFIARTLYSEDDNVENVTSQSEVVESAPPIEEDVVPSDQPEEPVMEDVQEVDPVADKMPPTAFMISNTGYFLTQYSAVSDARSLRLRQNDTIEYKVDMVIHDLELDIAVLRLEPEHRNELSGLPFRLATTQAFANTEVLVVGRDELQLDSRETTISALESEGSFKLYQLEMEENPGFAGAPVISKNGNIVAIAVFGDGGDSQYVKSIHIVGLLARSISEPGMGDYVPSANNRLAGLERPAQLERMAPYVLQVIKFY